MDDVTALLEIESLKQLKARYCRHLDTKDWQAWRSLFADDFIAFTRASLGERATVHQVHAPELELTSATTARGIWALEDVVRLAPGINLRGYGHYRETYEKVDGRWVITASTLTRLREDVFNLAVSVYLSDRVKRVAAAVGRRLAR
jgi:hypothetical protein